MLSGAKILDVPIFVTEQYPKGLGKTVEELELLIADFPHVSKMSYSSCIPEVMELLKISKKKQ